MTLNEQKLFRIVKGLSPLQHLTLYAKVRLFVTTLLFKTIKKKL